MYQKHARRRLLVTALSHWLYCDSSSHVVLKAYGDQGYGARVTHSADLAIHFEQKIKSSGGAFVLSHPRSFVNVCFWWVPPALRPFNPSTASEQDLANLGKVIVFHSLLIIVAW
jgi:hypothetical protein